MKKLITFLLVALIRIYKIIISPLLGQACRFIPTCSEYSQAAILRYGPFKGIMMSIKRVLRCHPLHHGGFDPLP